MAPTFDYDRIHSACQGQAYFGHTSKPSLLALLIPKATEPHAFIHSRAVSSPQPLDEHSCLEARRSAVAAARAQLLTPRQPLAAFQLMIGLIGQ